MPSSKGMPVQMVGDRDFPLRGMPVQMAGGRDPPLGGCQFRWCSQVGLHAPWGFSASVGDNKELQKLEEISNDAVPTLYLFASLLLSVSSLSCVALKTA